MPLILPKTSESAARNVSNFESNLNQIVPLNDQAFLRVLSQNEALAEALLGRYAANRAKQCLAITADEDGLFDLGVQFNLPRKQAVSAQLTAEIPGTETTIIPTTIDFVSDSTGIRYFLDSQAVVSGGVAVLNLTAQTPGVIGNLSVSDTLTIGSPVAGIESTATVTIIDTIGADQEGIEAWRARILVAERAATGGGNNSDYKIWSEGVAGVKKIFSFAGKPFDSPLDSFPGDRTLYVEADETIDADGIAPQALLDSVREAVAIDPDTGLSRPPLGIEDGTLTVQSITRTSFFTRINNLVVSVDIEAATKTDIDAALTAYFKSLTSFVTGIDPPQTRNDIITAISISTTVQSILTANNASAESIIFGLSAGASLPNHQLNPGELAKNGGVSYNP